MSTDSSPRSFDVIGIGANSVDFVNLLPAVPQPQGPNAKMRIRRQIISCGGQMTTAMACCARFGLRAKYVGVTGTDENGRRIRSEMLHHDVDMSDAVIRDVPNQFAVIMVDESTGERIVLWDRDERLALRPREIPAEALRTARLIHVDDVDQNAAIEAALIGRQERIPVTSDIDRLTDRTEELVAAVSIPIFAEHVPAALTGKQDPEAALRALRKKHDGLLCVTLGAQGALALDGDRAIHSPGFPITAVDTTGAGDVFRGGFIYATLRGWPIEQVLRFANAAAAVSCTRLGALAGIPDLADVEAQLGAVSASA
ncbi:MAG TPA: PfkB family carbohydrate kinase [Vicinamibacterales bacterium]